ncbi:uncharacterized protein LOC128212962 [Mya arenaria]|uniref:uncharacterized protein LOC128212962 n=1 Tax=Mya arenaria TaxID=6604 RepID=UPI0022E7F040|nr:uncharacterized protein LOC128212962 [Mya arenaria]
MDITRSEIGIWLGIVFIVTMTVPSESGEVKGCPSHVQGLFFLKTFKKMCYMFVNKEKHWDEARSHCWRDGGEMVAIKDKETMDFIKETLNSRELGWTSNGVWNGASDLRNRGWEWTTGEPLSGGYEYWAPGEPSKVFQIFSFENCCCMRRSEGWLWHDYHCHLDLQTYNFICQFPLQEETSVGEQLVITGAPMVNYVDNKVTIIGLIIAGCLILLIMGSIIYCLHRKHEHQKRRYNQHIVQYQASSPPQRGIATIIQGPPRPGPENPNPIHTHLTNGNGVSPVRPVSNIYLEPSEVAGPSAPQSPPVYDEVGKIRTAVVSHVTDGGGSQIGDQSAPDVRDETSPLLSIGGAASAGDLAGEAGASVGNGVYHRENDEYVDMRSTGSRDSGLASLNMGTRASEENLKGSGATGSAHEPRMENIYTSPMTVSDYVKQNGKSVHGNNSNGLQQVVPEKRTKEPEIHIYCNSLDVLTNDCQMGRPLPPVPAKH